MSNLPCKDCICLAICKNQIIQVAEIDFSLNLQNSADRELLCLSAKMVLVKRCSIFKNYVIERRNKHNPMRKKYSYPNTFLVLKYMGLIK